VRVEGALRRGVDDLLAGAALWPDRSERRRQVDLHEAAVGRPAAAEGSVSRPARLGNLRQDQFAFDAFRVSTR
jgi:hypothetical protein